MVVKKRRRVCVREKRERERDRHKGERVGRKNLMGDIKVLSVVVHEALKRAGGTYPVHHTYWKSSSSPTSSSE